MNRQDQSQFTLYAAGAAIPRHQRAGVWGLAALAILLCGLFAGWLFGGGGTGPLDGAHSGLRVVDGEALLARQEQINQRLRERIAGLERALGGDACAPAALEALKPANP